MNFLDQIKDLANKTLGTNFTTEHSEAEVLRALDAALTPVTEMNTSLSSLKETIEQMNQRMTDFERALETKTVEVDETPFNERIEQVESKIPDLTDVNSRIEEIAGEVAAIKANKPLQKETQESPHRAVKEFDNTIKLEFKPKKA